MADVTFVVAGVCGADDPHYSISVRVNGVERGRLSYLRSKILTSDIEAQDAEIVASAFVRHALLTWRAANPSGTIGQFRTYLEAQVFKV